MERDIKFAVSQMDVIAGRPDKNVSWIIKETEAAKSRKVDVILFPEMAVSGYMLGDEWENESFIQDLIGYNQDILEKTEGIAVFWGNVYAEFSKKGEDGRIRKYNAIYVAQDKKWVSNGVFDGHTFKSLMPKYREFDDERHFYSLPKLAEEKGVAFESLLKPFPIKVKKGTLNVGAILCEDMWCEDYTKNPTGILVKNGAEVVVNLSASPWTWRKNDKRHRVVRSLLEKDPVPFLYVNNVGIQNNGKNIFLFDGSSTVYNPDGSIVQTGEDYKNQTFDVTIPSKSTIQMSERTPYDKQDIVELHKGLVYGIRRFFENVNAKKAVIGLSGGIDSAVDLVLLSEALGNKNILAVNMPSKFNSQLTKNAAMKLASTLGVEYKVIPIQESVDLTIKQFEEAGITVSGLGLENIQARDRGSRILAGVAAALGAIFINNGNKTETALGYATLYGDINGALAPLGDLYKYEIYDLARYINEMAKKEIIPQEIIDLVPSAELSEDQDVTKGKGDPIIYPYHDRLVRAFVEFRRDPEYILNLYSKGKVESELGVLKGTIAKHFKTNKDFINDLEHKWKLFKINYFKRIQGPPNIAVSRRAFGYDLRESQNGVYFTRGYNKLKKDLFW